MNPCLSGIFFSENEKISLTAVLLFALDYHSSSTSLTTGMLNSNTFFVLVGELCPLFLKCLNVKTIQFYFKESKQKVCYVTEK